MNYFKFPQAANGTKHLKDFFFSPISHQLRIIQFDITHISVAGIVFKAKVIKHEFPTLVYFSFHRAPHMQSFEQDAVPHFHQQQLRSHVNTP